MSVSSMEQEDEIDMNDVMVQDEVIYLLKSLILNNC